MLAMTSTLREARSRHWQVEMDADTITLFAFSLAIGAGLGLLIDSFLKGMYVPKHWHQVLPAFWALIGLHIWQRFKNDIGAFLGMLTFYALALMHGRYIEKAGTLYQGYNTAINTPDPKITLIDAQKQYPGFQLFKRVMEQETVRREQVVEFPAFNMERHFWGSVLRMYDHDPVTQKHVDLTEERWVIQKKMFSQKPFANMKLKAEHFGLLKREHKGKSAGFVIRSRDAVALVAAGDPLPDWTPPPH